MSFLSILFTPLNLFLSKGLAISMEAATSPFPTPASATDTAAKFGEPSIDFTWLFLKTIFAMIVVIALAIVILRYIIPKITHHRSKARQTDIQIVDRVPLDSKKALYVLNVEGRRLLISASEHYVGFITELEGKE